MKKRKLIDKIEHKERQMWRWLRISFAMVLILLFYFLVAKPHYFSYEETKEVNKNIDDSLSLDKNCVINIGKELCNQQGTYLQQTYINEFTYSGIFYCYNAPKINITAEQLEGCSNGKK